MINNDEIFFLCVLAGAEEILGIENPVDGFSEEDARKKWEEVSKSLYEKKILYNGENDEICISDDYAKISAALSFPDIAFECPVDEGRTNYIFIRGSIYVVLGREEECELKLYNREGFINFINHEFMFSSCENEISIEISEDEMNNSVEFYTADKLEQALEVFDGRGSNAEDLKLMLELFVSNNCSKDFIGYRNNQETPSQALFKTLKTEAGTWLFKVWNGNVKICRCNNDKALSEVLGF